MANQYSSDYQEQRKAAERALRLGLATVVEIAHHYGLKRQTVAVWSKGIDATSARAKAVARALKPPRMDGGHG